MGHIRLMGLIGLMGLLGSCSGNDVPEPTQEQQMSISFSGNMPQGEAISRTDKGLEEVLDNKTFKVWGYKNTAVTGDDYTDYQVVMPGYKVDYETNTGSASNTHDWEYVGKGTSANPQYIKYWDFSAYAYRFFGYALGNGTTTSPASAVTEDATDASKVTFTTSVDCSTETTRDAAPYFTELWFSTDKANDYGKVVTLKFTRPYARVRFLFKFADNLNFGREQLSDIKFYPTGLLATPSIPTAGNVSVTYPLTGTGTKETWSSDVDASKNMTAFLIDWYQRPDDPIPAGYPTDNFENWYYVVPATQGTYTVEVVVVGGEPQTATVPAAYMEWKAGYEYTYVFK
nr:fimbrillin family protein [Prevotella sp.]